MNFSLPPIRSSAARRSPRAALPLAGSPTKDNAPTLPTVPIITQRPPSASPQRPASFRPASARRLSPSPPPSLLPEPPKTPRSSVTLRQKSLALQTELAIVELEDTRQAVFARYLAKRARIAADEHEQFAPVKEAFAHIREHLLRTARAEFDARESLARLGVSAAEATHFVELCVAASDSYSRVAADESMSFEIQAHGAAAVSLSNSPLYADRLRHQQAACILQVLLRRPMQLRRLYNQLTADEHDERHALRDSRLAEIRAMQWGEMVQRCEADESSRRNKLRAVAERSADVLLQRAGRALVAALESLQRQRTEEQLRCAYYELKESHARCRFECRVAAKHPLTRMGGAELYVMRGPHRLAALVRLQKAFRCVMYAGGLRSRKPLPAARHLRLTSDDLKRQLELLESDDCSTATYATKQRVDAITATQYAEERGRMALEMQNFRALAAIQMLAAKDELVIFGAALKTEQRARGSIAEQEEQERSLLLSVALPEHYLRSHVSGFEDLHREFLTDAFEGGPAYAAAAESALELTWRSLNGHDDADMIAGGLPSRSTSRSQRALSRSWLAMSPIRSGTRSSDSAAADDVLRHMLDVYQSQPGSRANTSAASALSPQRVAELQSEGQHRSQTLRAARKLVGSSWGVSSRAGLGNTTEHEMRESHTPRPSAVLCITPTTPHGAPPSHRTPPPALVDPRSSRGLNRRSVVIASQPPAPSPLHHVMDEDAPLAAYFVAPSTAGPAGLDEYDDVSGPTLLRDMQLHRGRLMQRDVELKEERRRRGLECQMWRWFDDVSVTFEVLFSRNTAQDWLMLPEPNTDAERQSQDHAVQLLRATFLRRTAVLSEMEAFERAHCVEEEDNLFRGLRRALEYSLTDAEAASGSGQGGASSRSRLLETQELAARRAAESEWLATHTSQVEELRSLAALMQSLDTNARARVPERTLMWAVCRVQTWWRLTRVISAGMTAEDRAVAMLIKAAQLCHVAAVTRSSLLLRKLARDMGAAEPPTFVGSPTRRRGAVTAAVQRLIEQEESCRMTVEAVAAAEARPLNRCSVLLRVRAEELRALVKPALTRDGAAKRIQQRWRIVMAWKRFYRSWRIQGLLRRLQIVYRSRRASRVVSFTEFVQAALHQRAPLDADTWRALPKLSRKLSNNSPYVAAVQSAEVRCAIHHTAVHGVGRTEGLLRSEVVADEDEQWAALMDDFERHQPVLAVEGASRPKLPTSEAALATAVQKTQASEDAGRRALEIEWRLCAALPFQSLTERLHRRTIMAAETEQWTELVNVCAPARIILAACHEHYLNMVAVGANRLLREREEMDGKLLAAAAGDYNVTARALKFELDRAELLVNCLVRPQFRLAQLVNSCEVNSRELLRQLEFRARHEIMRTLTMLEASAAA
jgi:hypothetical protein